MMISLKTPTACTTSAQSLTGAWSRIAPPSASGSSGPSSRSAPASSVCAAHGRFLSAQPDGSVVADREHLNGWGRMERCPDARWRCGAQGRPRLVSGGRGRWRRRGSREPRRAGPVGDVHAVGPARRVGAAGRSPVAAARRGRQSLLRVRPRALRLGARSRRSRCSPTTSTAGRTRRGSGCRRPMRSGLRRGACWRPTRSARTSSAMRARTSQGIGRRWPRCAQTRVRSGSASAGRSSGRWSPSARVGPQPAALLRRRAAARRRLRDGVRGARDRALPECVFELANEPVNIGFNTLGAARSSRWGGGSATSSVDGARVRRCQRNDPGGRVRCRVLARRQSR